MRMDFGTTAFGAPSREDPRFVVSVEIGVHPHADHRSAVTFGLLYPADTRVLVNELSRALDEVRKVHPAGDIVTANRATWATAEQLADECRRTLGLAGAGKLALRRGRP